MRAYGAVAGLSLIEIIRDERVFSVKPPRIRPGGMLLLCALA
jgi:hypothetical protein